MPIEILLIEDNPGDARLLQEHLREAGAEQFNLTPQNCPTHPSFIKDEQLAALKKRGLTFFGFFTNNEQIGFVAVEKSDSRLFYLEKLAVLPDHRHRGSGGRLVRHALEYIRRSGGKKVSIGIINEHTVLKNWYAQIGFKEVNTRKFLHLPFTICFMEMDV